MNKKLFLVDKTARLTCTWIPTGEMRTPLIRRWTLQGQSPAKREGGLRLYA
jgi:hypothetical protein